MNGQWVAFNDTIPECYGSNGADGTDSGPQPHRARVGDEQSFQFVKDTFLQDEFIHKWYILEY